MLTALVLAANREGPENPLAARFGVSHKCLVPFAGRPLIDHVLLALSGSKDVTSIIVSIDGSGVLEQSEVAQTLQRSGLLKVIPASDNLADSVIDAAKVADFPLLITTADNVLLNADGIATMIVGAKDADAAAAFARKASVLAAHPEGQRRFYEFADDAYSNCNCYWISSFEALKAANVFREGGQFAKNPMRIVRAFGLFNMLLFRFGIGSLAASFNRFSRRLRLKLKPVIFEDGSLAIDVDNDRTYGAAETLMMSRLAAAQAA